MSHEKLVRKNHKTLPKKFAHKVTVIEEAQDLTTMRVDELIGSLTTFEMSLDHGETSKKKGIALKFASEDVDDEDLVETMNILAKNFNKSLERFNKKPYSEIVLHLLMIERIIDGRNQKNKKTMSKNYYTTLTDDDSKVEDQQECNFVAFTAHIEPLVDNNLENNNEDEADMTEEEMLEDYKLLYTK
ncbi:hypothetical protein LIER_25283 [Lithospermum erythrorhizon]|uniref:UBN2 domain-containing protein n=1 Tax=Lithospermum erythrorhizon TaxID=34254 RepID=A0AAV3R4B8_LITER